jgi:hypothetical protein
MSHPSPTLSEQIFNHAMRFAAPFASEPGHTWAAIPTTATTHEACSIASDRFREWLAHSFHHEHGISPSHHSLRHAVRILEAHAASPIAPTRKSSPASAGAAATLSALAPSPSTSPTPPARSPKSPPKAGASPRATAGDSAPPPARARSPVPCATPASHSSTSRRSSTSPVPPPFAAS